MVLVADEMQVKCVGVIIQRLHDRATFIRDDVRRSQVIGMNVARRRASRRNAGLHSVDPQ